MQPLEITRLPLTGVQLIEASAGTGKTYTLAGLYLRLLLGLGGNSAFYRPLDVAEILVVTFTDAATQELKERIRSNIQALRLACLEGQSDDQLHQVLLAEITDYQLAATMLLVAERHIDCAAIYTIHGFCQRVLQEQTLAVGVGFDLVILEDESALQLQAILDVWRSYCYPLPLDEMQVFQQCWATPYLLQRDIVPYLGRLLPINRTAMMTTSEISQWHQHNFARIKKFKLSWLQDVTTIEPILAQASLNRRSYSKRHVPSWLNKITQWARQPTLSFEFPPELSRFSHNTLTKMTQEGAVPQHPLFQQIDMLLAQDYNARSCLFPYILQQVQARLAGAKVELGVLGFTDLLSYVDKALQQSKGATLAAAIQQRYPFVLIDEFQDTDPQQYRIFKTIYANAIKSGMILIGDPKQAIYAFRGGDIFTYLQAKQDVMGKYTLTTNWRATKQMVASVNTLFGGVNTPFLLPQLEFHAVQAGYQHVNMQLCLQGQRQPALDICIVSQDVIGVVRYREQMAQQCALQIVHWLHLAEQGQAELQFGEEQRLLQAGDIAILVRNQTEAKLISTALRQYGVATVYLSQHESVFITQEAQDLYWVLAAILQPQQGSLLRTALATKLLGVTALQLYQLDENEEDWEQLTLEFMGYRRQWQQFGIITMWRHLLKQRNLAAKLLADLEGERRLTDLLHLVELLQEAAQQRDNEQALLRWYAEQLIHPNHQLKSQQKRLEQETNLVKIVTFHKSKGLEYPIVCIPFGCFYKEQQQGLYHDRENFSLQLDLQGKEEVNLLIDEERLAEDLRLLYVAITRAAYHCYLGVAPVNFSTRNRLPTQHELHRTALGYLLNCYPTQSATEFMMMLKKWAEQHDIGYHLTGSHLGTHFIRKQTPVAPLTVRHFRRRLNRAWRITSYTALTQQISTQTAHFLPQIEPLSDKLHPSTPAENTIHTFPKGAIAGTCLHALLEQIDFTQPEIALDFIAEKLQYYGLDTDWALMLQSWLAQLLATPLDSSGLTLKQLTSANKQAEFGFSLPLKQQISPASLNEILAPLPNMLAQSSNLQFEPVEGILTGFIDLIFYWQGRYFLLDYKSNWLGETLQDYSDSRIVQELHLHRYDLQYQLYTLALHRYLRQRLPDYNYQTHFGGVFYLFLRGMTPLLPRQSVYFHCPEYEQVIQLDKLFAGGS